MKIPSIQICDRPIETENLLRFKIGPLGKAEGGGCLVELPGFPGYIAGGAAPEEAMAEGRDALKS